jgi:hypothetical protein
VLFLLTVKLFANLACQEARDRSREQKDSGVQQSGTELGDTTCESCDDPIRGAARDPNRETRHGVAQHRNRHDGRDQSKLARRQVSVENPEDGRTEAERRQPQDDSYPAIEARLLDEESEQCPYPRGETCGGSKSTEAYVIREFRDQDDDSQKRDSAPGNEFGDVEGPPPTSPFGTPPVSGDHEIPSRFVVNLVPL